MDAWIDRWVHEYMQEFCLENWSSVLAREVWDGLLEMGAWGFGYEGFGMRLLKGETREELK